MGATGACGGAADVHSRAHRTVVESKPGVEPGATCHGRAPGAGNALGHEASSSGISVLFLQLLGILSLFHDRK